LDMPAELFIAITTAVFEYALDKLDLAEKARSWLKEDHASLAFQKALARSYAAFARQYPEYAAAFFDASFLAKEAVPELSKLLVRNQHPDPALLAQAWGESLHRDVEFSKQAIKPASDFLAWMDAELKGEPALQPLYDSRALDNIEAGIDKLTTEVRRALDAALKFAEECSSIIEVKGDVKDSVIMPGYNNQVTINHYYSGNFLNLRNFYEPPDAVFDRVRVKEFIGRAWLTAKVKAFLNDPMKKSGAFLVEGEAGVGKSAFMAHLVSTERYLHLFGEQFPGESRVQAALLSLGSQIITRFRLTEYERREDLIYLAGTPQFLQHLLSAAAQKLSSGEKIVIVCDALDEAGNFPDGNVFGLPNTLPDGVYFILSQRPVPTKLPNYIQVKQVLDPRSDENLQDMEDFLSATAKRSEISSQLHARNIPEATFIRTLKEKSLGVWIYLYYVLDIQNGYIVPLDLEDLPTGLAGYYNQYWSDWRDGKRGHGEGRHKWDVLYAPLLTTLAAAQEAITTEQLIAWSGVQTTPQEVRRYLREDWRAFITERASTKQSGKTLYSPYHLSFRDFLTGRVGRESLPNTQASFVRELAAMTTEAHKRIINAFETECGGEWERLVEQEYPRLHLSAHLAGAGEHEALRIMLTEGDEKIKWAEARYRKEETYSGFLSDLQLLWERIEKTNDYALAIRCMLIENSIHSLASNISPELLVQLAQAGIWSYPRCLATVRENSDSYDQARALNLLAPELPPRLLQDVLAAAREIKDEYARASALSEIAPHLSDLTLKSQVLPEALTAAREIKDEDARASALSALAPHLSDELKSQVLPEALAAAREIKDEYARAYALSEIVPHLSDELKPQALQEALAAAREIKDESVRASALIALAPHLSDELKSQVLAAAREIKDEDARASALITLAPHLSDELKSQVFPEALAAAREIKAEDARAYALSALAPHLSDELKPQALQEALAAAREIKAEDARALSALAPHLSDLMLKSQVLATAREIKNEYARASALSDLAPHLNKETKIIVLQEALYLPFGQYEDIFNKIISAWQEIGYQGLREHLIPFFKLRSRGTRDAVVGDVISNLSPALVHFGRKELVGELLRAIQDTARWWP
jgi:hypothetical protein